MSVYLEKLDKFPSIQSENAKLVDQFADLLNIAIKNLTDANIFRKFRQWCIINPFAKENAKVNVELLSSMDF